MSDPNPTLPEMIDALEKRIADQRERGGTIMDYGTPDPLDVSMLAMLKTFVRLRDATSAASVAAEEAFAKRHPERAGLIERLVNAYRFSTITDRQRAHEIARAISGHPMIANPATALEGPYPHESPFGAIGKTGSPLAYLIDPGAGSASDLVSRFWPMRYKLDDIHARGGSITPLYANGPRKMTPPSDMAPTVPESEAEWSLETNAFHAAGNDATPAWVRETVKALWFEVCAREKAVGAFFDSTESAAKLQAALNLLGEARNQLEHMDERSPSGTTPAVIARIDDMLKENE